MELEYIMSNVEQDTIYQYLDGRDLLQAALMERRRLLQQLEQLAQAAQCIHSLEKVAGFHVVRAQALLFELAVIGEDIDTLIIEINKYAVRCGGTGVQRMETTLQ